MAVSSISPKCADSRLRTNYADKYELYYDPVIGGVTVVVTFSLSGTYTSVLGSDGLYTGTVGTVTITPTVKDALWSVKKDSSYTQETTTKREYGYKITHLTTSGLVLCTTGLSPFSGKMVTTWNLYQ